MRFAVAVKARTAPQIPYIRTPFCGSFLRYSFCPEVAKIRNKIGYLLEKYNGPSTRFTCPGCNKHRQFTRYVDASTNEYLADHVGICNRLVNCGYHYTPAQYFQDNGRVRSTRTVRRTALSSRPKLTPSTISRDLFEASTHFSRVEATNLFQFFVKRFGAEHAQMCATRYRLGCSKRWPGANIFWQIDKYYEVQFGKIMLYDPTSGKRDKQKFDSAHHALRTRKIQVTHVKQCLFGEHLLAEDGTSPVGIVESEKTAMIASLYLPELVWMACGGLGRLTETMLQPISKRRIILYPDLSAFPKWDRTAHILREKGFSIVVSDILETTTLVTSEERSRGLDLGDFLPRTGKPPGK